MARVPQVVPQPEALVAEQLRAEEVIGQVQAGRREDHVGGGEHRRHQRRAGAQPLGSTRRSRDGTPRSRCSDRRGLVKPRPVPGAGDVAAPWRRARRGAVGVGEARDSSHGSASPQTTSAGCGKLLRARGRAAPGRRRRRSGAGAGSRAGCPGRTAPRRPDPRVGPGVGGRAARPQDARQQPAADRSHQQLADRRPPPPADRRRPLEPLQQRDGVDQRQTLTPARGGAAPAAVRRPRPSRGRRSPRARAPARPGSAPGSRRSPISE